MKKIIYILSIILFSFTSCSDDDSNKNNSQVLIQLTPEQENMNENIQQFAWELLEKVYLVEKDNEEKKNMNLLVSPLSLNYALAMLQNGADGETLKEILATTKIGDHTLDEINSYYKVMSDGLIKADRGTIFSNSNSIWYNENISLEDEFINLNKKAYDAEITAVNFSDPNTVNRINQWCSDKTNGKIPKIKNGTSSETIFELLNAIYFYGTWAKKFDESKTEKDVFTRSDGEKVDAMFMKNKLKAPYHEYNNFVITSLGFGNDAYHMFFVLPKEYATVPQVIMNLKDQWDKINWTTAEVDYIIPKFETSYDIDMVSSSVLKSLGINQLFTSSADLSKMTDAKVGVSEIIQKTYLKIDEKSAEAAVVTKPGYVGAPSYEQFEFRLDRPFLYGIWETSTGSLLFLGYMDDPTVKE